MKNLKVITRLRRLKLFANKTVLGASAGVLIAFTIYLVLYTSILKTGYPNVVDLIIRILLIVCGIVVSSVFAGIVFSYFKKFNLFFVSVVGGVLLLIMIVPNKFFTLPLIALELTCGAIIGFSFSKNKSFFFKIIAIGFALLLNIAAFYFLLNKGDDKTIPVTQSYINQTIDKKFFDDPSLPGPYNVKYIFYGSGNDKTRTVYADSVAIKTEAVDASPFFNQIDGIKNALRKNYWGFNVKNYPLNAKVWYPDGEGPFPLVLIVHGNHIMTVPSELGFDYLGKLLASRGYIFASVDENFLNNAWFGGYYYEESFVRGWLLLKHLEAWRSWNEMPNNLFYKKIDLKNISLIGHSRGGTAIAVAAFLNDKSKYYLDASQNFNFNFSINGLVHIAPVDVFAPKSESPLMLSNMNLLLIKGGYDQDVYWSMGNRFYNRHRFTNNQYHFKASVSIYRANHSQFNTKWGQAADRVFPENLFLNTRPILSEDKQQKIAQAYISAFLDVTHKNKTAYLPLLKDYRQGFSILPTDYYVNQFQDANFFPVACYEYDFNIALGEDTAVTIAAQGFDVWKEDILPLRNDDNVSQNNTVVFLEWGKKSSQASYVLSFDSSFKIPATARELVFDIYNNSEEELDFSLALTSKNNAAEVLFSKYFILPPQLVTRLTKKNPLYRVPQNSFIEKELQTIAIPLKDFGVTNNETIRSIRFLFNKSQSGKIILDNIGFR